MKMLVVILLPIIVALSYASPPYPQNGTWISSTVPNIPVKRSYVCPPNFIRLSHRCYFFSKEKASWQTAYFQCRELRSNLAVIKTQNQDKLIRKTLSKKTLVHSERWIGGVYDWEQMQWKWAASGKPLTYQGFQTYKKDDKNLRWHCIIIDPALQFRWNAKSCYEEKHYICHTKLKIITNNKDKKKLLRQYKVNKLNEIPIPDIPGGSDLDYFYKNHQNRRRNLNTTNEYSKNHIPISLKFEINNDLNAQFAENPAPVIKKRKNRKKNRRNQNRRRQQQLGSAALNNGTVPSRNHIGTGTAGTPNNGVYQPARIHNHYIHGQVESEPSVVHLNDNYYRRRRNRVKEDESIKERDTPIIEHIKWKTYRKESNFTDPRYPQPIVEEFHYVKER